MNPHLAKLGVPAALQSALPNQFHGVEPGGKVLVLDGDALAYKCAATVKTLLTAIRRFQQGVLELMFLSKCSTARIHLTSSGCTKCHRALYPTALPYQGNRSGKDKPALLEPLREAMLNPENWLREFEGVFMHRFFEADDVFCMDMWSLQDNAVLASEDKDSRIVPWPRFNYEKATVEALPKGDLFGYIERTTTAGGNNKIIGHGWKFLLWQLLAGDTADNVRGLTRLDGKLCGPIAAFEYLDPMQDFVGALTACIQAYADNKQDVLAELEMLWLRRNELDSGYAWLMQQPLTKQHRAWIEALRERQVQYIKAAYGVDITENQCLNNLRTQP